jgi:hypothetical protein
MGVTDKGRNSLMVFGRETFGTNDTMDDNHCAGNLPDEKDKLRIWQTRLASS